VRHVRREAPKMIRAMVVLLRNTTWKCGRVESLVVKYLENHLRRYGTPWSPIKDMVQHFELKGKQKSEFFDALRRLEKRHIIRIKGL